MKKKKRRSIWSIFFKPIIIILSVFLVLVLICGVAGGIVYHKYKDDILACKAKADEIMMNSERSDFSKPADTKIYDSEGEQIGTINTGHYEYVPADQISQNLKNAYIAQEDRRFYEHRGVDYIGLMRAGVALIKHKGEITQGGSTITQQVIKNTYLTQEQTFKRKIVELFAAPQMEQKYSKDDIMEFYCNTNFYANRCYGVAEASRYYFDKTAAELTVWEAATLAGISNNPSRYDPVAHPETSKEKRNQVIDNMLLCEMITEGEALMAKSQPLTVAKIYEAGTKENYQTSYAIHCAALELMKNDGFPFQYVYKNKKDYETYRELYKKAYQEKSDLIRNGGFEIYTSLDSRLQELLQDCVDQGLAGFEELQENGKYALQGAAVCVENQTGYVRAIVGGRGTDDEYNRGFLSKRQPGSTIKPLIDYAPAFETGYYYPSRLVDDHQFEDGPKNSGGHYYGELSVREALNRSLNTVAWQVLEDIGPDTGIGYLGQMRFSGLSYMDNGNSSMSIGGFTDGASVAEMAKGYSVLADEGVYNFNTCITGITSQYEGEVYRGNTEDERIFTEDTAYMITDILKGTLDKPYGTGYGLGIGHMPAAGKTGTTNNNKDAWFCGYTKYYTTAVWMGYDTPKAMPGIYGKTYAGKIWQDFMIQCHEGLEPQDWTMPSTVSLCYVDWRGEKTDKRTGKQDLFSAVAEARAMADREKWEELEKKKKADAWAHRQTTAAPAGNAQVVEQLQALIGELGGLSVRDGNTQAKVDQAYALLGSLSGTPEYDAYKPQVDAAAAHVAGLAESHTEAETEKPQEIGPGVGLPDPTTNTAPSSTAVPEEQGPAATVPPSVETPVQEPSAPPQTAPPAETVPAAAPPSAAPAPAPLPGMQAEAPAA